MHANVQGSKNVNASIVIIIIITIMVIICGVFRYLERGRGCSRVRFRCTFSKVFKILRVFHTTY